MADILFVNTTGSLAVSQEVNGTMLLATKLLQAGMDTDILRFGRAQNYRKDYQAFIQEITDLILQYDPKCVSFYTLWPHYHIMLRIASELKQRRRDIITVFGGPQASATAKSTLEAMDFVDYICTGEGESTVVPFFRTLLEESGKNLESIPGLYYRKNGKVTFNSCEIPLCDLNTLPHWDDRLYINNYTAPEPHITSDTYFMPIDAGRGCPYNCSFCCTSLFWRRTYRLKSPERIVSDILFYNQKFGIKSFWFSHDAFTTNMKLVSEVCDHILNTGLDIKWRCTARIDCVSEELILKMKQAGMTHIELGIETGSRRMQKLTHKNLNLERATEMVRFLLSQKVHVDLFFMYGFPDETEEDLNDTLELLFSMLDLGIRHASMSFCRFNPSTEITEQHLGELVLDPSVKILSRGIFGYNEELEMIGDNRALFPFYYHLNTPLRNKYQHLFFLSHLYQKYPNSIKHLRKLYNGNNLKFFDDLYNCNRDFFDGGAVHTSEGLSNPPLELLYNVLENFDLPYVRQLKALLKYDYDIQRVFHSAQDISLQETYAFSYIDYQLRLPIEQYSNGKTEILLQNINGIRKKEILRFC